MNVKKEHRKDKSGSVLYALRTDAGLSIGELSKQSGAAAMTICRLENRDVDAWAATYQKLAAFFGVSVEALARNDMESLKGIGEVGSSLNAFTPAPAASGKAPRITGLHYHLIRRGLTPTKLDRMVGVSARYTANQIKKGHLERVGMEILLRYGDALGVTVDELLRTDCVDISSLEKNPRQVPKPSRTENPKNPITIYRRRNNLTLRELGDILGGTSRENARAICHGAMASEHQLSRIAAWEGITVEAFLAAYAA